MGPSNASTRPPSPGLPLLLTLLLALSAGGAGLLWGLGIFDGNAPQDPAPVTPDQGREAPRGAQECVAPEVEYLNKNKGLSVDKLDQDRARDVNDDGVKDVFVTDLGSCGSGGCTWTLYASHRGCFREVAEIEGAVTRVMAERRHGHRDLLGVFRAGEGGETETIYRFDGRRYRARCSRTSAAERFQCEQEDR